MMNNDDCTRVEAPQMSRRTFLGGSAVAFGTIMLSGALGGMVGCSSKDDGPSREDAASPGDFE